MSTFQCQYEKHGGAEIQAICLADCNQHQWACLYCIKEKHYSHLDNCLTFQEIISKIENIYKTILTQIEQKKKQFEDIVQKSKLEIKKIESNLLIYKEWIELMNNQQYQDIKIQKMIKFLKKNQKQELQEQVKQILEKGIMLKQQQKFDGAMMQFEKALEIDSNCLEALYGKGTCLRYFKKYSEAILYQEKVLKINPKHWPAYFEQGACLQMLNQFNEAIISYNKALTINSNNELISVQKNYCQQQINHK